ncbi:ROK family transcriptional regulator [Alkalicoccus daliensis]|uniref:Sugar kinase of the NBD/HSP70 family, may contain an N-terminal HTH domain n=1 Tax=Alkalicoccus daliensis TaxID=745820 RepID=A0A1H0HWR3_9BACI|nr:ROK family transcriptional regulator [Alkalicoccus daliensis]SDO23574.1 Sugar kinase of the NBD/HSP70 family, may contain an N-terminal HTH domain [Alkalicoccus daliensis]
MANYQKAVKLSNKSVVLQAIREEEPISRAELSQKLGLTKATVSSLVEELINEEYCYQTGLGKSSGGRRPLMLQFNEKAGYTISCDIGVNYILVVLTDLRGSILHELYRPFNTNDFTRTVMEVKSMIDDCIKETNSSPFAVVGIGFGVPGLVNKEGKILSTPNLDWVQSNIKEIFQDQYQVPVIIENEANAGAYGEKMFGAAQYKNDFIYVSAGIGIGVGIVLDGNLMRGAHGFMGEMGHTTIVDGGLSCRCGNRGCWEMYASEMALLTAFSENGEPLDMELLLERADKEEAVRQVFDEIGYYLGVGLTNIIHTFNPQKIVIGNRLAKAQKYLLSKATQVIEEKTLPVLLHETEISFSQNYQYSTVLGLAAFSIETFLSKQFQSDEQVSV